MTPGGATGEEKNQTKASWALDGWFDWLSVPYCVHLHGFIETLLSIQRVIRCRLPLFAWSYLIQLTEFIALIG